MFYYLLLNHDLFMLHPHEKVMVSFLILSFVFDIEYLNQFIIKYWKKGQFQNSHEEHISKLSLIFMYGRKLAEIFKVKDNAQNQKRYRYFFVWVYFLPCTGRSKFPEFSMIALTPITPPLPLTPPSPSKDCSMYSFLFTAKNLSLVYFSLGKSQKN